MLLESSNEKKRQFINLLPRRFGLKGGKIHLYGAPRSGKTCIALHYIKDIKNSFYIDCNDLRNRDDLIKNYLLKISMEKKIEVLILDNMDFTKFMLPAIENIITINEYQSPNLDFVNKKILPLSFEEYISFDTLNQDINHLFANFLNYGNLPMTLSIKDPNRMYFKQQMLSLVFRHQLHIFMLLCQFQGKPITTNQIYSLLKKDSKISKDSIYSIIKDWQDRGILYLVPNYSNERLAKKVFLWDFSIRSSLSYDKNILCSVENMVFLELLKLNSPIYYSNKINLICNNNGYIISLFSTIEIIKDMLVEVDFMGLDIVVITFGLDDDIKIKDKIVKICNFINFALEE